MPKHEHHLRFIQVQFFLCVKFISNPTLFTCDMLGLLHWISFHANSLENVVIKWKQFFLIACFLLLLHILDLDESTVVFLWLKTFSSRVTYNKYKIVSYATTRLFLVLEYYNFFVYWLPWKKPSVTFDSHTRKINMRKCVYVLKHLCQWHEFSCRNTTDFHIAIYTKTQRTFTHTHIHTLTLCIFIKLLNMRNISTNRNQIKKRWWKIPDSFSNQWAATLLRLTSQNNTISFLVDDFSSVTLFFFFGKSLF